MRLKLILCSKENNFRDLNVIYLNKYFEEKIKENNLGRFEPFKLYNIENNHIYFITLLFI